MKKIEKFKLTQLSKNELDARRQNALKGGGICYCTCNGCSCPTWDGTGPMPEGRANNDLTTSKFDYASSSLGSYA